MHPPPPRLTDGRIVLAPWSGEHVPELVAAVRESVGEVGAWLPWCRAGYDVRAATDWVRACAHCEAAGTGRQFAVLETDGRLVGGLGLRITDHAHAVGRVGYWIRTSAMRRGHATAAVRIAVLHAFAALGLVRLEICALPENVAGRRVAERAGARFECIARNRILRPEGPRDAALYSLVPADVAPPAAR